MPSQREKLPLEKHLEALCENDSTAEGLCYKLERVRDSALAIWDEQRLIWFTDHRARTHSRNVIMHLGTVMEHLQETSQALSAHELYVLLAACYLHDIGMQDFRIDENPDQMHFTNADYEIIRDRHPERSKHLIIERSREIIPDAFFVDLGPDSQYTVLIALVSQGHGSAFFEESIMELQNLPDSPGNKLFRGDLITALLLMGDELDLHQSRATFPAEITLSPQALLHHYLHHYVTRVEIVAGRTPKHRRIRLTMEYPADSDDYRYYIKEWFVTKLRRQCEITRPILEACTEGELNWDDQINIKETTDQYDRRRSFKSTEQSRRALYHLQRELLERQIIDRDTLIETLRNAISKQLDGFQAIRVIDQEGSDWSQLMKWCESSCNCCGGRFAHVAFHQSIARNPIDIIYRLSETLVAAGLSTPEYERQRSFINETQQDAPNVLAEALMTDLKRLAGEHHPLVLIFERVDKAEPETECWLIEWFLPELSNREIQLLVLLSQFENGRTRSIPFHSQLFSLPPFTEAEIFEYLHNKIGFPNRTAEAKAKTLFSMTRGNPQYILAGQATEKGRFLGAENDS